MKTKLFIFAILFMAINAVAAPSVSEIAENAVYSAKVNESAIDLFKRSLMHGPFTEEEIFGIFFAIANSYNLSDKEFTEMLNELKVYCYRNFTKEATERILERCLNCRSYNAVFGNHRGSAVLAPKGDPRAYPVPVTPDPISPQN